MIYAFSLLVLPLVIMNIPLNAHTINFDSDKPGKTPSSFTTALTGRGTPGIWITIKDETAPSGSNVLAQISMDTTNYRFPVCVYDGVSAADVDVRVRFKPIKGRVDQAAGIVWRYQDKNNYYVVRANALENNVVLYKIHNGKRTDLDPVGSGLFAYGRKTNIPTGKWSTLRVVAKDTHFKVYVNVNQIFEVVDTTFQGYGKVGLWTKADSYTLFDDLEIYVFSEAQLQKKSTKPYKVRQNLSGE